MATPLPQTRSEAPAPTEGKAISARETPSSERWKTDYTETELAILRRRSVRRYKKEQVPEWMVKRILEAGRFAPSSGNFQPWKFVVVREPGVIEELTNDVIQIAKALNERFDYRRPGRGWMWPITRFLIRRNPNHMHPTPFRALAQIAEGRLGLYHGAPTVIVIFKDVRGVANPDLDAGIAGQNMVLAAHSLGLGTCWVGFVSLAFAQLKKKWEGFFGIEFPYAFASSIALGWPFGEPDGMTLRQTHPVDWYEEGGKKTFW